MLVILMIPAAAAKQGFSSSLFLALSSATVCTIIIHLVHILIILWCAVLGRNKQCNTLFVKCNAIHYSALESVGLPVGRCSVLCRQWGSLWIGKCCCTVYSVQGSTMYSVQRQCTVLCHQWGGFESLYQDFLFRIKTLWFRPPNPRSLISNCHSSFSLYPTVFFSFSF